jgi:hypothetical protein
MVFVFVTGWLEELLLVYTDEAKRQIGASRKVLVF